MPSSTVENYLKQIYLEQEHSPHRWVAIGKLAAALSVVPGTATVMVKSLAESGLADYRRGGVRLTRGGEALALHVLRRHRLLELFLVKALALDWSEVHQEAEQLEHAVSDKVLERIDRTLGFPRFDPHGDPIPPSRGKPAAVNLVPLARCRSGSKVRVARIIDQEPAFLQYVDRHGLAPGAVVEILEQDALADALRLRIADGSALTLGASAALKILTRSAGRAHSPSAPKSR